MGDPVLGGFHLGCIVRFSNINLESVSGKSRYLCV